MLAIPSNAHQLIVTLGREEDLLNLNHSIRGLASTVLPQDLLNQALRIAPLYPLD